MHGNQKFDFLFKKMEIELFCAKVLIVSSV